MTKPSIKKWIENRLEHLRYEIRYHSAEIKILEEIKKKLRITSPK